MKRTTEFLFVRTGGIQRAVRYDIKSSTDNCKLIEPLGVEYCMANLEKNGVKSAIYDISLVPEGADFASDIVAIGSVCIGFSALYSRMIPDSYDLIEKIRSLGYKGHITIGGTYPTLNAEKMLKDFPLIDSICRVEGEVVSVNLYRALVGEIRMEDVSGLTYRTESGEIVNNPPESLIHNLDQMPNPIRDNFERYLELGGIIQLHSSRGCHANCSFCGTAAFYRKAPGPKWRARSAVHVVDELESLRKRTEKDEVWFTDDNFLGPGRVGNLRAKQIAEEILSRSISVKMAIQTRADNLDLETIRLLKQAGLRKVFIGIESGTERHLATYNKSVTRSQNVAALQLMESQGIFVELGFIGFDPHTTFDEFESNIEFIEESCASKRFIHHLAFDLLIPYRGTPIADRLLECGLAVENGLDCKSVITDKRIFKTWFCVNHLINDLGASAEHIKTLMLGDQSQQEGAQEAIFMKNRILIDGLRFIHATLGRNPEESESEITGRLTLVVTDLNNKLGIKK